MLKKSQVSIFIVIGIILLIVMIFLFFNSGTSILDNSDTRQKNQVKDVVEDCIEKHGEIGVSLLGYRGGRISISEEEVLDPRNFIDFGFKIVNWDVLRNDYPTIDSMENQLNEYVEREAYNCIDTNLRTLRDVMDIELPEEYSIVSSINHENVVFEANFPITYREKNLDEDESSTIVDYYVELDNKRLGDMYELAMQIYQLEERTYFMEELILDQIYSAADYDSPISMPGEGMFFSCAQRIWTIPQLKENLASLNNNNFKFLYFEGTRSKEDIYDLHLRPEYGTDDSRAYFESHYHIDLPEKRKSFEDYSVEVYMPSTQVTGESDYFDRFPYREFEVTPSSGSIVKSMDYDIDMGVKIPLPCIQIFHHLYDLDYDLMVRIVDHNDDANRYTFQFPLRVLIKNNNPKRETSSSLFLSDELTRANSDEFCRAEDITREVTTRYLQDGEIVEENITYVESAPRKYPLRIFAKDTDGNYLSDVNITYDCVSYTCDIGVTKRPTYRGFVRENAPARLDTNFPYCLNGQVSAVKEGYHKSSIRVNTTEELIGLQQPKGYDIELIRLKEYDIDISNFLLLDRTSGQSSRVYDKDDGFVYAVVENAKYDFESFVIWPIDIEGLYDSMALLDKSDVRYNVSVIYTDDEYNLMGLLEIKNWTPNVYSGNKIEFLIPRSDEVIVSENYEEYQEYMELMVSSGRAGVFIK